jgi:hypothetical protein
MDYGIWLAMTRYNCLTGERRRRLDIRKWGEDGE